VKHRFLLIFALLLPTLFSCEKEKVPFNYQTVEIPADGVVRAIDFIDGQWVISGGNNGSTGFILTADPEFDHFSFVADTLQWPVHDQISRNNRFIFSADYGEIYFGSLDLSKINIHYPPEEFWVNTLNKKALWQIEETQEMGIYMAGGGGFGKGLILFSPNNGAHWKPYELNNEMRSVGFQPPNTIWACGYGLIIKTSDFDSGWEIVHFENKFFTGIDFFDKNSGLLSTFEGKIYRTSNGGNSWNEVSKIKGFSGGVSINKIRFLNDQLAIAIGNGGFLSISHDGGKSWKSGTDFNETNLYDMAFVDGWLYLVGSAPEVYKLMP